MILYYYTIILQHQIYSLLLIKYFLTEVHTHFVRRTTLVVLTHYSEVHLFAALIKKYTRSAYALVGTP